jgi:signal transduction histidine kinase
MDRPHKLELSELARSSFDLTADTDTAQRAHRPEAPLAPNGSEEPTRRELTDALEAMREAREEAEQASQVKTRFLGMVSHELRTPLTALKLQVDVLRRAPPGAMEARQQRVVERMAGTVSRLTELIESLLQYSRIQSGRLKARVRPFYVSSILCSLVDDLRIQAEPLGLRVELDELDEVPLLESDPDIVRLILSNLAQNALRYTDRGYIRFTATASEGWHRFAVEDTGQGIPKEERSRIFEPFERLTVSQLSSRVSGIGLGLALVREMVGALNGTVELESEVGLGSRFIVLLPSSWPASA